jgi:periodic tryptophan protein 1
MIVGTFLPEIEIWNLDSEDCAPIAVLGDFNESENAKKSVVKKFKNKKEQETTFSEVTHTDAIMCLSLNPYQQEYLASGSADCTVRIWDIDELSCKAVYNKLHSDKV